MSAMDLFIVAVCCLIVLVGFVFYAYVMFRRAAEAGPFRETRDALKLQIEALKEQIAEGHRTIADIQRQIDEQRVKLEEGKEIIAKAEKERQWLEEHEPILVQYRGEEESLKESIKNLTDKRNELDEEVRKRQEKLETAEKNLREAVEARNRAANDLAVLKPQLDAAKQQIEADRSELDRVAKELGPKREELERIRSELAKLEAQRKEITRLDEDIRRKREEAHAIVEGEIAALQDAKARLIAEVGELKQKAGEAKDSWMELDAPAVTSVISKTYKRNQEEESEWLAEFEAKLKNNGLVFHPRVIHAFHTGLKVADASPLVVLAGISGTGKSLLPQLYARAIGMNFLPLSVQPRWDSPQDMLGFYNYMERRYKATELSRLLWQYDIWNNEVARQAFGNAGNLPMNLVLLDEMNIARVEYYFSDFLSRLELRRNINSANSSERSSAEIEIEGGVLTGADKSDNPNATAAWKFVRRLFPAQNTLFVGTMNEDESTQTLSDKVIDRSNVIRFGRPTQLDTKSDAKSFMDAYGTDRRISQEDWRKWVIENDDYSESTRADVLRIASALNAAMETVGRPFGLRNVQAMLAYCENYPITGDKGFKLALADQIEMKILPKLNGLEKDARKVGDALRSIGNILSTEIGDIDEEDVLGPDGNPLEANGSRVRTPGICKAFETASSADDGVFFRWKGISR